MHPKYPNVFSPIKLGPVELPNRFYSSPHAVPMNILGKPTDDFIHYNVARTRGGCGLLILSMAAHGRVRSVWPNIGPAEHVAAFRALTALVTARTKLIFLATPNNPTGVPLPLAEIERLHRRLPSTVVLDRGLKPRLFAEGDVDWARSDVMSRLTELLAEAPG